MTSRRGCLLPKLPILLYALTDDFSVEARSVSWPGSSHLIPELGDEVMSLRGECTGFHETLLSRSRCTYDLPNDTHEW